MFKTIPILVGVREEWEQFSSITCNFQSMFCRPDSKKRKVDDTEEEAVMDSADPRRVGEKLNFDIGDGRQQVCY